MTAKEINTSATGLLVLILPIAFLIVLLFKAWPVLLMLFVLSITVKVWQQYQWEHWSRQVNPFFNQLIKDNQGCLTALDLAMKANLSGTAARQYLDKKAEEFGAQRRDYEGKGTVYYFLTASALGSMFEESEPPLELEDEDIATPVLEPSELPTQTEPNLTESQSTTSDVTEPLQPPTEEPSLPEPSTNSEIAELSKPPIEELHRPEPSTTSNVTELLKAPVEQASDTSHVIEPLQAPVEQASDSSVDVSPTHKVEADLEPPKLQKLEHEREEADNKKEDSWEELEAQKTQDFKPLIQAELAKRLDVHSSTVGKRKSDDDFPEWSQSRDPEGIAWEYNSDTKEFVPLDKIPESE
jgi:hypothetical protein